MTHPSVACPEAEGTCQAMMQTIDSSPTMTRDVRCIVLSFRMVHDGAVSSRPHHCRSTHGEACPRQACGLGVRQPSYTKRVVRSSHTVRGSAMYKGVRDGAYSMYKGFIQNACKIRSLRHLSRNLSFAGHLLNREKLHASRTHPLYCTAMPAKSSSHTSRPITLHTP